MNKRSKVILVLGALALLVGGFAVNSVARGYHNSVAGERTAKRLQAEGDRLRAEAEMWRGRATSYKAEARFWEGRAKAYKTEAQRWRSLQALTKPLGALTMFVLALAVLIFASGITIGVTRIAWGFGTGGEEKLKAEAVKVKAEAEALSSSQKKYVAAPDSAVSKWLQQHQYEVKEVSN